MRLVLQRVTRASVSVGGEVVSSIGPGFVAFVAVAPGDNAAVAARMAAKVAALRFFDDADGRMDVDVRVVGGEVLAISQFTLYGDARRGNRPSYAGAAASEAAQPVYEAFCDGIEGLGLRCGRGLFGEEMQVELVNDGPVTLILDSDELNRPRQG